MPINLRNYTTEVPAQRSIENIEKLLVSFGAKNTMKEFGADEVCTSISFIIEVEGMKLPFRLPANVDKIYKWLLKKKPNSKKDTLRAQANRVAWKQQYEWLHLQLTMIEMEQAEKLELLFPFLYDVQQQKSFYNQVKEGGFKALIGPPSNQ